MKSTDDNSTLSNAFGDLAVERLSEGTDNPLSGSLHISPEVSEADRELAISNFSKMVKALNAVLAHATLELTNLEGGHIRLETMALASDIRQVALLSPIWSTSGNAAVLCTLLRGTFIGKQLPSAHAAGLRNRPGRLTIFS